MVAQLRGTITEQDSQCEHSDLQWSKNWIHTNPFQSFRSFRWSWFRGIILVLWCALLLLLCWRLHSFMRRRLCTLRILAAHVSFLQSLSQCNAMVTARQTCRYSHNGCVCVWLLSYVPSHNHGTWVRVSSDFLLCVDAPVQFFSTVPVATKQHCNIYYQRRMHTHEAHKITNIPHTHTC